jgi:hypothetical protein
MKYQPLYMPATDNEELLKEQPFFNTEEEAWDYIHEKFCQCNCMIDPDNEGCCISCEAEWMVDVVE